MTKHYCTDEAHDTPCELPCDACRESCFEDEQSYWQACGYACKQCGDLELIEPDEGVANGPLNDEGLCTNCVEDNSMKPVVISAESAAMHNVWNIEREFGWAGTFMTRGDVESELGRDLTDDEWSEVQGSWEWRKGIQEQMAQAGFELIDMMLRDLGLENNDE